MQQEKFPLLAVAGLLLGIVALTIAYWALVSVPQQQIQAEKEATRLLVQAQEAQEEREQARKEERDFRYRACLAEAWQAYSIDWERHCERIGRGEDCALPFVTSENLDLRYAKEQEKCLVVYR